MLHNPQLIRIVIIFHIFIPAEELMAGVKGLLAIRQAAKMENN